MSSLQLQLTEQYSIEISFDYLLKDEGGFSITNDITLLDIEFRWD